VLSGLVAVAGRNAGRQQIACGLVAQSVEQRPFKPLVPGSSPGQPTKLLGSSMAWVYILRGAGGRHYIGSTTNLERRLGEHRRGHTHSTKRLGGNLTLVASLEAATLREARELELQMKRKKNPQLALGFIQQQGGQVI
jgi:predicted GIY-YIG superfamily endonuclease